MAVFRSFGERVMDWIRVRIVGGCVVRGDCCGCGGVFCVLGM